MNWAQVWTLANWERLLVGDYLKTGEAGGLLLTLQLGLLAIALSTLFGAILGSMRHSRRPALHWPAAIYIETLRNIPLLILVFWAFLLPPQFGVEVSQFQAVLVSLTLLGSAYLGEIVRGGLRGVSTGHVEAARTLGMGAFQIQARIVLPQAFFNMLPAISGRYVVTIKNTSLAFLIGLSDLTDIGKQINSRLLTSPAEVYLTLMLIYFGVNSCLSHCMHLLERRALFNKLFCSR